MALSILLSSSSLKAASYIVTIYGDVVEPRGGAIWIGNLIEVCAVVGISEALVRTAVSRLVAAGQLVGERAGRRSYYRLTAAAQADFAAAARSLFGPVEKPIWQFAYLGGQSIEADIRLLEHAGYTRLSPRFMIGVRAHPVLSKGSIVFSSDAAGPATSFQELATRHWDLHRYASAYHEFLTRFKALVGENQSKVICSWPDRQVPCRKNDRRRSRALDRGRASPKKAPGLEPEAKPCVLAWEKCLMHTRVRGRFNARHLADG